MSKEEKENGTGWSKSIATVLVLVIFCLIAVTVVILGALGISFLKKSMNEDIETYEETMYQGYRTEIKSEIQSVIAIIQGYYDRSRTGELTEAEAKKYAMEEIRVMR